MKIRILPLSLLGAILAIFLAAMPAGHSTAALRPASEIDPLSRPSLDQAIEDAEESEDMFEDSLSADVAESDTEDVDDLTKEPAMEAAEESEGPFQDTPDPGDEELVAGDAGVVASIEPDAVHPFLFGNDIVTAIGDISWRMLTEAPLSQKGITCNDGVFQGKVQKGETLSEVLGTSAQGRVQEYIDAASKVFSLRSFREGQPYTVHVEPGSGDLTRFEYEINANRRLVVEGSTKPKARLEAIDYTTTLASLSGTVDDNLYQAVADIGESPQLALQLVDLFGSEINFIRNLQAGDSFTALIEKRYRNGEYKGYGRILAATFTNGNKTSHAFLFGDGTEEPSYFNQNGESLKKTLLQSPLAFTRMTSSFSHNRRHPILGTHRPHLGVDYAAPVGTPVKAVGAGTVTRRGWAGGYGNQVIIKHTGGLESLYAHLSGFARGLREGQKVSQGQVIGFVGSTGLSTGPHLDFRLRQNGTFINPAKAINPRASGVAPAQMAAFKKVMAREQALLDGGRITTEYNPDSIVPTTVTQIATGKRVIPIAKKTRTTKAWRLGKFRKAARAKKLSKSRENSASQAGRRANRQRASR